MTVARQKHSLRVPPETVHIDFLVESDLELFALDLQDVKSSGATLIIVTPTPVKHTRFVALWAACEG
jgi:hypothetical protein